MNKRLSNLNRIESALKNLYKDKVILNTHKKENLEKIVNNVIELKMKSQVNSQLDKTVELLIEKEYSRSKQNSIHRFFHGTVKWQVAMFSTIAFLFITATITLADPGIQTAIQTLTGNTKGSVELTSVPSGAFVKLRNKNSGEFNAIGTTPFKKDLEVGDYEVYLSSEGYKNTPVTSLSVKPGDRVNKNFKLEEQEKNIANLLTYENKDLGLTFKYPEGAKVDLDKISEDDYKLTIKDDTSILVIQTQENTPTLLPNYESLPKSINGNIFNFRKYVYENITENYSKLDYKYGISTDGLYKNKGYSYFIYSESLTDKNTLFDLVIDSLTLSKEKLLLPQIYSFNSDNLGLKFNYNNNFVYEIIEDSKSKYSAKLVDKNNPSENILINWEKEDYKNTPDYINSNFEKVKIGNYTLEKSEDQNSITYLLPNNTLVKFVGINSLDIKNQIELFKSSLILNLQSDSSSSSN